MQYIAYCGKINMSVTNKDVLNLMPPQYALFGLFFAFHNQLQSCGDSFYKEITCKQFFLLASLQLHKESPTANEICQTMKCSRQNVKEILNVLANKGFVELIEDKYDKRKKRITVTDKFKTLSKEYKQKEIEFMNLLFKNTSEDESVFVYKFLSKLEKNLQEYQKINKRGSK